MLKQDKSVWATGLNSFGQLGDGSNGNTTENFIKVFPSGAKAVAAGDAHSMVVK